MGWGGGRRGGGRERTCSSSEVGRCRLLGAGVLQPTLTAVAAAACRLWVQFMTNVAASSAARRRVQADRMAHDNMRIYKRLQVRGAGEEGVGGWVGVVGGRCGWVGGG